MRQGQQHGLTIAWSSGPAVARDKNRPVFTPLRGRAVAAYIRFHNEAKPEWHIGSTTNIPIKTIAEYFMAMRPLKKISYSIRLDVNWLRLKSLSLQRRLTYIVLKYYRLCLGGNSIPFLSQEHFLYDNKNTPATLQSYPSEIQFLKNWIDFESKKNVLDIGANIGQFSVTLASMFPKTNVWCFEPNPNAYQLLTKNVTGFQIQCFNYGVGAPGVIPFFFVPGFSAKGSFMSSNASINLGDVKTSEINVDVVSLDDETVKKIGIPHHYDLIKIDVEGYEYEVLNALSGVGAKYIYIEFSMGRSHSYSFPDLIDRIRKIFGPIEVLYCDAIDVSDKNRTIGNILAMTVHDS